MRYVTTAYLSDLVRRNLSKIPHDIDLVVGVPRSGMLPASMIALALNKRLADINSFVEGKVFDAGVRGSIQQWGDIRKVLIVDDSINTGMAMNKAKKQVSMLSADYDIIYMAIIASSAGTKQVDIFLEIIDDVRVFEWNLFHHYMMENACLDIDGVLNEDPIVDDDGPIYMDFLKNAKPLHLPTVEVNTLISCRLEKYRPQTEQWLKENGVRYKNLVLLNMPDKRTRIEWGKHGEYKAEYFNRSNCSLFIESSLNQAGIIAKKSWKPVICLETNELVKSKPRVIKLFVKKRFPALFYFLKKHFKKHE